VRVQNKAIESYQFYRREKYLPGHFLQRFYTNFTLVTFELIQISTLCKPEVMLLFGFNRCEAFVSYCT